MKAVVIHELGGPEVLKIEEVERPAPAADEVLVKVYASGINIADCKIRDGGENDRLQVKLPVILGWDLAGIVEETGSAVGNFKKGDAVYGMPNFPGDGSYAEYAVGKAGQISFKPASLDFNEASGVPLAGLTAWHGIFECGKLKSGQLILIHGAAGGVGNFALQFAKARGAYVIGTASENDLDFIKKLGANEAIDYKNQKFEDLARDIDVVFDAVGAGGGDDTQIRSVKVLKEGGILVSTQAVPLSDEVIKALTEKNASGEVYYVQPKSEWLDEIAQLIDEGKVKVTIGKVYPLEEVAEAQRECETGHVRGKFILEVKKAN